MVRFSIERTAHAGYDARRLADAESGIEAVFLPGLGMVGASLRHGGEELLGRTENLERYATSGSTMGIPLLHPWANRLDGFRYAAAGREVELDPSSPLLHPDGNGLPIHGIAGASLPWTVAGERADGAGAELSADLAFDADPALLAVFPFRHRLMMDVRLDPDGLTVRTTLTANAAVPAPVSFGYHPYFQLPGMPRAEWHVEIPVRERLELDELMIPTGRAEPYTFAPGPLGELQFDDGFAGLLDRPVFALAGGGRRLEVAFLDGYPYAQVFAPPGGDFICFEPMTAPTNALVSGDGLRLVEPGGSFSAAFRISIEPL